MSISNIDPQEVMAETLAQDIYTGLLALEKLYSKSFSAVASVKDILAESSDMLVAMNIAISDRSKNRVHS